MKRILRKDDRLSRLRNGTADGAAYTSRGTKLQSDGAANSNTALICEFCA